MLLVSLNAQQTGGWRYQEMEVIAPVETPLQAAALYQLNLNIDMPPSIPGTATLYLTPDERAIVEGTGIKTTVVIADLNAHFQGWWDREVPPGYYTYQQIIDIADSLANAFPDICQKVILGSSVQGRQLAALKISDNASTNETEPEILFEAGIHGDEIGCSENAIRFARDLCKGYGNNTQITDLVNNRETWIWLMVNPDGRQAMSRYNSNYVDINRDGGYMWNAEGNSPGAWSQVETKAMRDFCSAHQFVVFTDYHSGTEYISYPWSYREDAAPDKPSIRYLASVYATTSGYNNLPYGQGYSGMYPINGSTKDFNYGSLGSVSWSMEISMQKQPPASTINAYYQKNKPSMLAMMDKAALGIGGTITDSLSGMPVSAIVKVNNNYPCYNDPVQGDYHKYLIGGVYDLAIYAPGYVTKTYENIVIPVNEPLTLNVALQRAPDTSWARKVMGCYILNNNPADEGYTPGAIGPADNIRYSLGKNGWVILDMGDTIVNKPGDDFRIIENDGSDEGYTVWAGTTVDGPWIQAGTATGSASFDLGGSLPKARYLKIKDSGTGGTTFPDAGVDVDAVENLHPAARPLFKADKVVACAGESITFTDLSRGTTNAWSWQFEGAIPSSSSEQNPVVQYTEPGCYKVTLTITDGVTTSTATRQSYITVLPMPVADLGSDTLICYDYQHITLDAGNPGATYLWNTGETTQTIETQCSGIDITDYYSVTVTNPSGCHSSDTIGVTCTICEGAETTGQDAVAVYPNPAGDQVYIVTGLKAPIQVTLTDLIGRVLLEATFEASPATIPLKNIASGICFLQVKVPGYDPQRVKLLKL